MVDLFSQEVANEGGLFAPSKNPTIKSISIKNYRAIKLLEIELDSRGVILSGLNKVGKTSVIEAVYLLLSGKLFDGRAKIGDQNITPIGAEKGTKTELNITFSTGFSFGATFWERYNQEGTIVTSRESAYTVNSGAVKSVKMAYQTLYDHLGIKPIMDKFATDTNLKTLDLVRLFYDISYLKQIDYKLLRGLIIDMVGDIKYTDIINENPNKYTSLVAPLKEANLDLEALKQRLRSEKFGVSNVSGLEFEIAYLDKQAQEFELKSNIVIDDETVKNAKDELDRLDAKISELQGKLLQGSKEAVKDIEHEITQQQLEYQKAKAFVIETYNKKVAEINETNSKPSQLAVDTEARLQTLKTEKDTLQQQLDDVSAKISNTKSSIYNKETTLSSKKTMLNDVKAEYNRVSNPQSEMITAPVSKERFFLHEAIEYATVRDNKLEEIVERGNKLSEEIVVIQDGLKELNNQLSTLKLQFNSKETEIEAKKLQIVETRGVLANEVERLERSKLSKPTLDLNVEPLITIEKQIKELESKKQNVLEGYQTHLDDIKLLIAKYVEDKTPHVEALRAVQEKEMFAIQVADTRKKLAVKKDRLLQVDDLLTLIKNLERDKFVKIDANVESVFGKNIKFKLFDYNSTDESIDTRVCDLLVKDGNDVFVNIKDINTGHFPHAALDFISHVKKHYKVLPSFLLIDEFGLLDENNQPRILGFGEQILATKVGNTKTIQIEKIGA